VTEQDILLRREFDALKQKYPKKFDVVYIVDKPSETWTGAFRVYSHFATGSNLLFAGPTGFISSEIIKQHVPPATLGDKVKVFVCGALFRQNLYTAKIDLARL
jgi:cytochrome-b5 reductase